MPTSLTSVTASAPKPARTTTKYPWPVPDSSPNHHDDPPPVVFFTGEDLVRAMSPRAREPLRHGCALSAEFLGEPIDSAELLSSTNRSVVVRCRAGQASVVVKHFRRRDSARNASGFGYLRARYGSDVLPSSARLVAHDDADRILIFEDFGSSVDQNLNREDLRKWISIWPSMVLPAESSAALWFRDSLAAADPIAAAKGRPGALPSLGLLDRSRLSIEDVGRLLDPKVSVLWCGDMTPGNFAPSADGGYRQIDTEGTGYCDPAILVAEVRMGLPSAIGHKRLHALLDPDEWGDAADSLAEQWKVDGQREIRARLALEAILRVLAPSRIPLHGIESLP
ncbi:hypothetical protein [Kocuria sp. TGY1127_2]|uniref:hypothetical protein n=1 Tax=Kocuria sp. TGY1127_2 TaxID=2711328 RepID=UPI0015B7FEE9|nr:hypothetical protein [Kocuria sp. TGY1127_2]